MADEDSLWQVNVRRNCYYSKVEAIDLWKVPSQTKSIKVFIRSINYEDFLYTFNQTSEIQLRYIACQLSRIVLATTASTTYQATDQRIYNMFEEYKSSLILFSINNMASFHIYKLTLAIKLSNLIQWTVQTWILGTSGHTWSLINSRQRYDHFILSNFFHFIK